MRTKLSTNHSMKHTLLAVLTVPLALTTWTAQAQSRTANMEEGTVIPVRLDQEISSKTARRGDSFTATLRDKDNASRLPEGTAFEGVIRKVAAQKGKDPGTLELAFQRMSLPDGRSYTIDGAVIGLDEKSVERRSDGRLVAKPGKRTDRLTYVGYGAGAGLLVSLFTKNTLRETLLGAGLGYLYGALERGNDKPRDVTLKEGTQMGVRLDRRVSYSLSQASSSERWDDEEMENSDNREIIYFKNGVRPVMVDGEALIPAAVALNEMNTRYKYNAKTKQLIAYGVDGPARVTVDSRIVRLNGNRRKNLSVAPRLRNGRLYVPTEFLAIASGRDAEYDEERQAVILSKEDK